MTRSARSRVITEPLGGSSLSLAVQSRRLPPAVQLWWPSSPDEWKDHVHRVRERASASWLEAIAPAMSASGAAAKRLGRVVAGGGVVVTTGQQAGLFGGPLYTLSKALTALALADALEQQLGIQVAPIFWAATDDADFAEASRTYVADADGLHNLRLATAPAAGTPMALAPLGDIMPLIDALRRACGSAAHAAYCETARTAYTTRHSIGDAYVQFMRGLLEPLGISVMDSSHPACRAASRSILVEALRRAQDIAGASAARAAAIRKVGFEPQVDDDRGLSLVFVIENGVKRRLTIAEAERFNRGTTKSAILAPNVLLRPIVERELFPTVGYVAGPGELAYFVQTNAVASTLGRDPVIGLPRWSCTVIEPFAERAMSRLGLEYDDTRDLAAVERRLATQALPESVAASWKRLQDQIRKSVQELGAAVQETSLMPPPVVEGLGRSLDHKLNRAERRLLAAAKRRDERIRRDLAVVAAALFPLGQRQERVLNYVPMLTRGGEELIEDMRRAAAAHALALLVERAEPVAAR